MFIGHYAAAFALKGFQPKASLGWLFLATQFVDILFFPFAAVGIESLKFENNYTAVNNFVMEFPFTHGLVATLFWSVLCYFIWRFFLQTNEHSKSIAMVMALAVASHWFADLIVHTPDLPILSGEPKFGFSLWQHKWATFSVEGLLLTLGFWYYIKRTTTNSKLGNYIALLFCVFMLIINYLNIFILPSNDHLIALIVSAFTAYLLFAALAIWIEKFRA